MNGRTAAGPSPFEASADAPAPQGDGEIEGALDPDCERGRVFPRQIWPEPCCRSSPNGSQRAQGRPGAGGTRWSVRYRNAHGVDRWGGRSPGLPCADGFTVSFVLSPGSDALLPPSPCRSLMRAPGWAATSPRGLDAQTPGVRTTRLLRPRTSRHIASRACVCSPPMTSTSPLSSAVSYASREPFSRLPPPCRHAARAVAAASTATRPAFRDDREPPLWQGQGCALYAINPKFGKVECFCDEGLTGCFARRLAGGRPRAGERAWARPAAPSSRAQRSNPASFRGGGLDCFAALAMTSWRQRALSFHLVSRRRPTGLARWSAGPPPGSPTSAQVR